MGTERYTHIVSLNKEQEEIVTRAKELSGASYSKLVVLGAELELKRLERKK